MAQPIVITSADYDLESENYKYKFPRPIKFSGASILFSNASFTNAFKNVSKELNNNTLVIGFPIFDSVTKAFVEYEEATLTLEDGYYSYDEIDQACELLYLSKGWYVKDDTINRFFTRIVPNYNTGNLEVLLYYWPTQAEATTNSLTSGGATFNDSTDNRAPYIKFESRHEYLYGFSSTISAPELTSGDAYSLTPAVTAISPVPPNIDKVTNLIIRCDLASNGYAYPSDVIGIIPLTESYQSIQQYSNPLSIWVPIRDGTYNEITLSMVDQNLNKQTLLDAGVSFLLYIKTKDV